MHTLVLCRLINQKARMSKFKYKFSIFTPCYNSSQFIHRVFETLNTQTYRNFEWIVINDASTDNTSEILREYIKTVDFNVKFFDLQRNQMLAANYNLAVSVAEGEIFFPHGHDDLFIPTVLEEYVELLDRYDSPNIAGIVARCQTQYGNIPSPLFYRPTMNYWEYANVNGRYVGEMPDCIKTDIMKRYMPFDTEKSLLPMPIERSIGCDGYENICYNKVVRTYYVFENETSLMKIQSKFSKDRWYMSIAEINKYQYYYKDRNFLTAIRLVFLYIYRSTIINKSCLEAISELMHKKNKLLVVFLWLPSLILLKVFPDNSKNTERLLKKYRKVISC